MVTDELTSLSNEEEAHKHRDAPTTFLSSSLSASLSNSTLLSNKEGNSHESPKGSIDFDLRAEENTPDFTKFHSVQELSIAQPEGGKDNQKWKSSASSKVKNTESQRNTTWASDDGNPQIIAEEMQSEIHQESRNEDPHLRTEKIKATRARELQHQVGPEGVRAKPEVLSATASKILERVYAKLRGREFTGVLDVPAHVDRLISESTMDENISRCYVGWCPFW
eukprot:GHVL01015349.1.p1 GENE.GHVL01015349.1~~GHVL01015349.1.p1  ORF type:complete len:223 (-),score=32.72 GHVL01015349.1:812-1480(-)